MFCLRSWIPILFFLLRTNASPVYLVLFISATYSLNRPCVYCSLLLFILVVALFDFQTPWFESPLAPGINSTDAALTATTSHVDQVVETAAMFARAAGQTAQAVLKATVDGVRDRTSIGSGQGSGTGAGYEWVRGLLGKKEWRIPCLDVLVRI